MTAALGSRVAPARFVLFVAVMAGVSGGMFWVRHAGWAEALVWGFDSAALLFILSLYPLTRDHTADEMRRHAAANDANRAMVLAITALVMLAVMAAMASDLRQAQQGDIAAVVKLVATLALAWFFTTLVFTLHYAHYFYREAEGKRGDRGGVNFAETPEPDYWDFAYLSFTAGMTFQVSDVTVTCGHLRRVVILQSLLSFVFNIGAPVNWPAPTPCQLKLFAVPAGLRTKSTGMSILIVSGSRRYRQ